MADEGIPFALGHALYMKAIHGGKAKDDKIDSEKLVRMLRGRTVDSYWCRRKVRNAGSIVLP